MHHIIAACKSNFFSLSASTVGTPFQSSRNPSTSGSKKTSISFPRHSQPGISRPMIKLDCSTHSHGGKLYGIRNTSHMLYEELILPNGLKPSVARPSLMFLASSTNHPYFLSKSFHASPSAGWLSSFSTGFLFNLCHCTSSAVLLEEKILFSLGINGKCHKTFSGIFFLASLSFHLDALQTGHTSFFLNSSETEHNYLGTHGLNCIRAPMHG